MSRASRGGLGSAEYYRQQRESAWDQGENELNSACNGRDQDGNVYQQKFSGSHSSLPFSSDASLLQIGIGRGQDQPGTAFSGNNVKHDRLHRASSPARLRQRSESLERDGGTRIGGQSGYSGKDEFGRDIDSRKHVDQARSAEKRKQKGKIAELLQRKGKGSGVRTASLLRATEGGIEKASKTAQRSEQWANVVQHERRQFRFHEDEWNIGETHGSVQNSNHGKAGNGTIRQNAVQDVIVPDASITTSSIQDFIAVPADKKHIQDLDGIALAEEQLCTAPVVVVNANLEQDTEPLQQSGAKVSWREKLKAKKLSQK